MLICFHFLQKTIFCRTFAMSKDKTINNNSINNLNLKHYEKFNF